MAKRQLQPNEAQRMQRKHIFAVNSSAEFLEVLRELLQDEGYNVTTTNVTVETVAQIAVTCPDVLIVDLVVGQTAEWELLQHIAADPRTKRIPVVVVSTTPALLEEAEAQRNQYGGSWYMSKPLDLDDLVEAVTQLTG